MKLIKSLFEMFFGNRSSSRSLASAPTELPPTPAIKVASEASYVGSDVGSEPKHETDDNASNSSNNLDAADLPGESDEESYLPSKKLVMSATDLTVEACHIRHTVSRFFGVHPTGFPFKTIVTSPESSFESFDQEGENIFARLKELNIILCGGAVTSTMLGTKVNDLDFYVVDSVSEKEALEFLLKYFPAMINKSINAITLKRKEGQRAYHCQLITRFHGGPESIFQEFDFTVTHGAYVFRDEKFVFGRRFMPDLARKVLVFSGKSNYPICALYRTIKYTKRGFTAPGSTLMHIALCIVQLKIENYGQLKEQLMGIDTMYLQGLLSKLSPDAPVDYGEFIDEAFRRINRINGTNTADAENGE